MITINNLPQSYTPYDRLIVCSNTLIEGANVVAIGDILPVLIGKGHKPRIWLQAIAKPNPLDFVTIVEESIAKHPTAKIYEKHGIINVEVGGILLLAVKPMGENSAEVETLDFRPLGFNMHGTKVSLIVGGSTFSGNTMSGGKAFVSFGE